mmetsp:Transcript_35118/g.87853  ORF Transcript_35118/g.87853 Transcript_35118/m.87853 type:complete len:126 (+) Transcript_35118:587-964(+)
MTLLFNLGQSEKGCVVFPRDPRADSQSLARARARRPALRKSALFICPKTKKNAREKKNNAGIATLIKKKLRKMRKAAKKRIPGITAREKEMGRDGVGSGKEIWTEGTNRGGKEEAKRPGKRHTGV